MKNFIGIIGVFLITINGCFGVQPADTFYVAKNGNNHWSGKLPAPNEEKTDGPFATVEKARDAIRMMKTNKNHSGPVTVMVRGGTYFLDRTIVFRSIDSGTDEYSITYMAYPGEKPVISGGRRITSSWKTYNGEIMVCTVPEVEQGKWFFRQLFVNGERQTRARIPREGYFFIEKAVNDTSFQYKEGGFKRWRNLKDIEVVMFHSWNETRFVVSDLDEEERIVRCLDPDATHPLDDRWERRYYVENVFEGLQQPGDWYLEKHTGKLYYWPVNDIENLEIIAPVLNQLVRFEDTVRYLNIVGLSFSDSDWTLPEKGYPDCDDVGDIVHPSAITYENARHCHFENNHIRNVGTYALELTGSGNKIIGNEIYSTGGGGIITRNYDKERNLAAYNHIHHCGEVYPSAVGINIDDGGGTIRNNLIHAISHSGIYARHWATEHQSRERENQQQGLIIEYNEIYDVMQKLNDGGGIFIRDSNIKIRNNLIHDINYLGHGCSTRGIYLGCETRNTIVENNVVYRAYVSVIVWYYNRNVTIKNNIFVDGGSIQIYYQNPKNLAHKNIKLLGNIIYYTRADSKLFSISGERSTPAESDYNVIFCDRACIMCNPVISGLPEVSSFEEWQNQGFDENSIVLDPFALTPYHFQFVVEDFLPGSIAL